MRLRSPITFAILILVFAIAIYIHTLPQPAHDTPFQLKRDGAEVFHSVLSPKCVQHCRTLVSQKQYRELKKYLHSHPQLLSLIRSSAGEDHEFQDYVWVIEKSVVHTCHRDNNGSFFNEGQRHPSYTMLVYLEPMERCLGVIPGSHTSRGAFNWNVQDQVVDLVCGPGDVILFDANLIHVGTLLEKDDHLRVQLKVTHRDDREVLGYYEDFNKVLNESTPMPRWVRQVQRHASCMVPGVSDWTQGENIRTARGSDQGASIGWAQRAFSAAFYGNPNYYDLPSV